MSTAPKDRALAQEAYRQQVLASGNVPIDRIVGIAIGETEDGIVVIEIMGALDGPRHYGMDWEAFSQFADVIGARLDRMRQQAAGTA